MLKNTSVFIAALAAFGTVVQGLPPRVCKPGLNYCGPAVSRMGYYFLNHYIGDRELYRCLPDQDVKFVKYCPNKCLDGGVGTSDYCR
ncbi:hypothetical protein E4U13_002033 [Claviceps humidiphila]|uniref:Uncharacterized protein n=1 Tax=Claviceps humidiphila TaxID=1294629 RepID=A0A9P7Q2T4_9HYPO|nr:hypothetical protein E4U13_002033 [Claviceps humidiphila]